MVPAKIAEEETRRFSIQIPINYEDTDAGGIVYYGNYLGYMERARNAFLRSMGFPLSELVASHDMLFVVREANLKYLLSAHLDDCLQITLAIQAIKGARIFFHHQVLRGQEILVDATIELAVVNTSTRRPMRIPSFLHSQFEDYVL